MSVKQIVLESDKNGDFTGMTIFHWEHNALPVISLFSPPLRIPGLIMTIAKAADKSNGTKPKQIVRKPRHKRR